jgi:hypothetical protein
VKIHNPNPSDSRSLTEQIDELEQTIELRRYLIERNISALRRDARKHLATPQALFTSAGLGMAVGVILRKRSNATQSRSDTWKLTQVLTNLFKIAAIARTLAATLPSRSHNMTEPDPF